VAEVCVCPLQMVVMSKVGGDGECEGAKDKSLKHKDKMTRKEKKSNSKNIPSPNGDDATDLGTEPSPTEIPDLSPSSESASSDEDDEAMLVTAQTEAEVLRTFARLKAKDPSIYNADSAPLYDEQLLKEAEDKWKSKKDSSTSTCTSTSSLTLRQIQHNQLLQQVNEGKEVRTPCLDSPSLHQEQQLELESIKKSFSIDSAQPEAADEEEEDFLCLKQKSPSELQQEEATFKASLFEALSSGNQNDWLTLKAAQESTPEDRFLLDYILNRGWVGNQSHSGKAEEGLGLGTTTRSFIDATDPLLSHDDDEAFEQQAEEFEFKHNFRFESASGAELLLAVPAHARSIEESVRLANSKATRRARQREAKRERKRLERTRLEESLKRTKNALSASINNSGGGEGEGEEAYFKEHWEGLLNGEPTRYKYRQVPASSFGLSAEEILHLDDSLLNAHASTKCLAAYFPQDQHEHWHSKCTDKKRLRKFWSMKMAQQASKKSSDEQPVRIAEQSEDDAEAVAKSRKPRKKKGKQSE
jgi:hypothetical protein